MPGNAGWVTDFTPPHAVDDHSRCHTHSFILGAFVDSHVYHLPVHLYSRW